MTYAEKLKDPRWQKKRLEIFERDEWECTECGAQDVTLHVHHNYYEKGIEPWDYPEYCYRTLCEDCHKAATATKLELDVLLSGFGCAEMNQVIGYALALKNQDNWEPFRLGSYEQAWGASDFLRMPVGTVVDSITEGMFNLNTLYQEGQNAEKATD